MRHISNRRRGLTALISLVLPLLLALLPEAALAQAWPSRQPIRLVAVFPPGGSVDQVARILSQPLAQLLGQTVIVENKGGASGVIGTASVVTAPADGYTFAVVFDTHGVNQSLMPNMPYDSKRDLVREESRDAVRTGDMPVTDEAGRSTHLPPARK